MTDFDERGLLSKLHALNVHRQLHKPIEGHLEQWVEGVKAHVQAVAPTTRWHDRVKELIGKLRITAATVDQDQRAFYEEAIKQLGALEPS